jgi:hypothetical protein
MQGPFLSGLGRSRDKERAFGDTLLQGRAQVQGVPWVTMLIFER